MSYYNHTSGESFTLDGIDYIGNFNVDGGVAYTGIIKTEDSEVLTPKSNFSSEIFLKSWYYNTCYGNISGYSPINVNTNDLLNRQGLDSYYDTINNNNLIIFKNLVIPNPVVFKFNDSRCKYYAKDMGDSGDSLNPKKRYSYSIDDLSSDWSFLNKLLGGIVLVDSSENFKYICTTGDKDYTIGGSFINDTPLEILSVRTNIDYNDDTKPRDYTYAIYQDVSEKRLIMVRANYIDFYDISNFEECQKFILVDRIERGEKSDTVSTPRIWSKTSEKMGWSENVWNKQTDVSFFDRDNSKFVKFGKNLRTYLKDGYLSFYNKYSKIESSKISLSDYGIIEPLALDIRDSDDLVAILHFNGGFRVTFLNPTSNNSYTTFKVKKFNTDETYNLYFSPIDSDTFFISSPTQFHTRSIENPNYPTGKLENCDLGYNSSRYIWGEVDEYFSLFSVFWNAKRSKERNNKYYNISNTTISKNGKIYTILANYGRFYALSQGINDRYLQGIDINTSKLIKSIPCSESSLGLHFNSLFSSIIEDTKNIINKCKSRFTFSEDLPKQKKYDYVNKDVRDDTLHGNETVNVLSLQRIFDTISSIQKPLSPTIIEMVSGDSEFITTPVETVENKLDIFINLSNKLGYAPIEGVEDERTIYWNSNKEELKALIKQRYNHDVLLSRESVNSNVRSFDQIYRSSSYGFYGKKSYLYEFSYLPSLNDSFYGNYLQNLEDILLDSDMLVTSEYLNGLYWWETPKNEFVPYLYKHKTLNFNDLKLDNYSWGHDTLETSINMGKEFIREFSSEENPYDLTKITRKKWYHINQIPFTLYLWRLTSIMSGSENYSYQGIQNPGYLFDVDSVVKSYNTATYPYPDNYTQLPSLLLSDFLVYWKNYNVYKNDGLSIDNYYRQIYVPMNKSEPYGRELTKSNISSDITISSTIPAPPSDKQKNMIVYLYNIIKPIIESDNTTAIEKLKIGVNGEFVESLGRFSEFYYYDWIYQNGSKYI